MNIITCTGYGGTGSSVVSDLFKEFSNVKSFGDFEFRFLQDPSGVKDLEFGIVLNNDRLTTSESIKKFKKYIDYLSSSKVYNYELFFDNKFKKISYQYIDDLVDVKWDGFWHQDIINASLFERIFYYTERIIQKKIIRQDEGGAILFNNIFKHEMYYSSIGDGFYEVTKKYIANLISEVDSDSYNYLLFDQLVPVNNIDKYNRYFDSLKVIVVDRDPRDLYLLNKCIWKESWIPSENIEIYIKWFEKLRSIEKCNDENIAIYLNFEDFIYNYEDTVEKICKFIGISSGNHVFKKKFFDPSISIKNTNLQEKYIQYDDDCKLIKNRLNKYCYNFK